MRSFPIPRILHVKHLSYLALPVIPAPPEVTVLIRWARLFAPTWAYCQWPYSTHLLQCKWKLPFFLNRLQPLTTSLSRGLFYSVNWHFAVVISLISKRKHTCIKKPETSPFRQAHLWTPEQCPGATLGMLDQKITWQPTVRKVTLCHLSNPQPTGAQGNNNNKNSRRLKPCYSKINACKYTSTGINFLMTLFQKWIRTRNLSKISFPGTCPSPNLTYWQIVQHSTAFGTSATAGSAPNEVFKCGQVIITESHCPHL